MSINDAPNFRFIDEIACCKSCIHNCSGYEIKCNKYKFYHLFQHPLMAICDGFESEAEKIKNDIRSYNEAQR